MLFEDSPTPSIQTMIKAEKISFLFPFPFLDTKQQKSHYQRACQREGLFSLTSLSSFIFISSSVTLVFPLFVFYIYPISLPCTFLSLSFIFLSSSVTLVFSFIIFYIYPISFPCTFLSLSFIFHIFYLFLHLTHLFLHLLHFFIYILQYSFYLLPFFLHLISFFFLYLLIFFFQR